LAVDAEVLLLSRALILPLAITVQELGRKVGLQTLSNNVHLLVEKFSIATFIIGLIVSGRVHLSVIDLVGIQILQDVEDVRPRIERIHLPLELLPLL